MIPRAAAAVTVALGLSLAGLAVPAHSAAKVFTVTMSPKGSVRTLDQAQNAIRAAKPTSNVVIRIKAGTYTTNPKTTWTTFIKDRSISFVGADGPRPLFVNARKPGKVDGPWLKATVPADLGFKAGRLTFRHLEVRGFTGGIALDGGAPKVDGKYEQGPGLNHNSVSDMVFRKIGDKHTRGGAFGYGAVILTNSSDNEIRKNTFVDVENKAPQGPKIHGTYVTHFSRRNTITGNTFTRISGDPVKLRDRSNSNTITGNAFTRAGHYSYYREEFCAGACLKKNVGKPLECASSGNRFSGNTRRSGYKGGSIPTVSLVPKSNTAKGPVGCPSLVNGYRVKA